MLARVHRMRSLNRGLVVVVAEREGHQMKVEAVVEGVEVRRRMTLVVGVAHLIEVKEVAGEHWIGAEVVEEVHWIEAEAVEEAQLIEERGEEVVVRCLFLVAEEQVEKKPEVMEERSKRVPKAFWAVAAEEEYSMEELHELDHGTAVTVYLTREGEAVEQAHAQESWEVH